jgi:hypothetical protein
LKIEEYESDYGTLKASVPQGGTLAPLLYNIFTSDLKYMKIGEIIQFADDLLK